MMYDVFLSYNRKDTSDAEEIARVLEASGFNVFFDKHTGPGGIAELAGYLREGIENSRCFALLHGPHCLGDTQLKEADYALSRGLDFRNVIISTCRPAAPGKCALLPPYTHQVSIEGSHFHIAHLTSEWLGQRLRRIGQYELCGFGATRTANLLRVSQPDKGAILSLDWRTFEDLLKHLVGQMKFASLFPEVILGINEGGLVIAGFVAHHFHRRAIGYLKHEGGSLNRKLVREHLALPGITEGPAEVLLVDSELKTGSALQLILPEVKRLYPHAAFSYAVLYAQLSDQFQRDESFPPPGSHLHYRDLLAARCVEDIGLKNVFFGGLFGKGRLDFPGGMK